MLPAKGEHYAPPEEYAPTASHDRGPTLDEVGGVFDAGGDPDEVVWEAAGSSDRGRDGGVAHEARQAHLGGHVAEADGHLEQLGLLHDLLAGFQAALAAHKRSAIRALLASKSLELRHSQLLHQGGVCSAWAGVCLLAAIDQLEQRKMLSGDCRAHQRCKGCPASSVLTPHTEGSTCGSQS